MKELLVPAKQIYKAEAKDKTFWCRAKWIGGAMKVVERYEDLEVLQRIQKPSKRYGPFFEIWRIKVK